MEPNIRRIHGGSNKKNLEELENLINKDTITADVMKNLEKVLQETDDVFKAEAGRFSGTQIHYGSLRPTGSNLSNK